MGYNVVGRAVAAGVVKPAQRLAVGERCIADPAYEAELEQRIDDANRARIAASLAASSAEGEGAYDHLFPPRTREERQRRADALNRERLAASIAIDDDTYRALFGDQ